MATSDQNLQPITEQCVNLADARLGTVALFATDEFFGPKERMLSPEPAVFIPGKYDDHGKWMDGWETGRRRSGGFDFCIVRLGLPGIIEVVDIDTSHFTGNFPPAASIDACSSTTDPMVAGTQWTNLVPPTSLKGNSHHLIAVQSPENWTHIRVNYLSGRRCGAT